MRHAQSKDLVVMFFYINQVFFSTLCQVFSTLDRW